MNKSALEALLVDQDQIDTERLVNAIRGKVGIDSKTGVPVLQDAYASLTSANKLIALLLAASAARLLDVGERESLSMTEITRLSGMPPGTVAPALRDLKQDRLLDQDGSKRYFVPRTKVIEACNRLDVATPKLGGKK